MKRTISLLVSVFVVTGSLFVCFPMSVFAESLYIKKIVSVVYDDSGSMSNYNSANWAYASYAMQSFCGLLNSDDQLFITYMSAAEDNNLNPTSIDLSQTGIQKSVDSIRNHTDAGNTPYRAVDTAFNKLKSVSDLNPNTQYWLVIITDGEFQGGADGNVTTKDLNSKLSAFTAHTMPNGTSAQITYMAIGDKAVKPDEDKSNGIYVYPSSGSSDIIKVMSNIADKVSGRSRLSAKDITVTGSDTVQITSSVPLLNIAVLSQKTSAKITSVKMSGGKSLQVERSVTVLYPETYGRTTDTSLKGGAFLIGNSGNNIESGTYTLQFDADVSLDDFVIMFEPALEIRMSVLCNGKEVHDFARLNEAHEGDSLNINCNIYEFGTDNEISHSLLPSDTAYDLSVFERGASVKTDDSTALSIDDYILKNCPTRITAQLTIKGFNPITVSTGEFTPAKPIVYTLEVVKPDNFSLTIAQLKTNTEKIRFIIKADGAAIGKDAVQTLPFTIDTEAPGTIVYEDDGSIAFIPEYREPVSTIPTGDIDVTGTLADVTSAHTTFYIKPIEYWIEAVAPEDNRIIRSGLDKNEKAILFEVFADGEKFDKYALEAADISYTMNSPYSDELALDISIENDGTAVATPKYLQWSWLSAYTVPTGKLIITAESGNTSGQGVLQITNDIAGEIIWNIVVPLLAVLFIVGHIFKKRLKYSAKIHYNHGESAGSTISGPKNGWYTEGLFTLTAFVPFITDVKSVNGVKFYASRLWNSMIINVKTAQHPEFSGTMDSDVNEQESIRINKNDINVFEGEKRRDMMYGNALIVSGDRNYKSCQIYLYSDV